MTDSNYRADLVDAKETHAMDLFRLAYMEGCFNKRTDISFNIATYGSAYRVEVGYTEHETFVKIGETPNISIPAEWSLEKIAEEELRLPAKSVNVFLGGKLLQKSIPSVK